MSVCRKKLKPPNSGKIFIIVLTVLRSNSPALRQRKEDIIEFAEFFIKKANSIFNKNITAIDNNVKIYSLITGGMK